MGFNSAFKVLIPDGNFKSVQVAINGLVKEIEYKFTRIWNSKSRFVVAGANKFTMLQQNVIFDYFSKRRIYNCIIVSQEQDVIDKEYSK